MEDKKVGFKEQGKQIAAFVSALAESKPAGWNVNITKYNVTIDFPDSKDVFKKLDANNIQSHTRPDSSNPSRMVRRVVIENTPSVIGGLSYKLEEKDAAEIAAFVRKKVQERKGSGALRGSTDGFTRHIWLDAGIELGTVPPPPSHMSKPDTNFYTKIYSREDSFEEHGKQIAALVSSIAESKPAGWNVNITKDNVTIDFSDSKDVFKKLDANKIQSHTEPDSSSPSRMVRRVVIENTREAIGNLSKTLEEKDAAEIAAFMKKKIKEREDSGALLDDDLKERIWINAGHRVRDESSGVRKIASCKRCR